MARWWPSTTPGGIETLITSGITPEERPRFGDLPKGLGLLQYLNEIEGPLRLADIAGHPRSVGFPEGHPPMKTFLGTPVIHSGERLGNIYLTEKEGEREFTPEDEETLVMFAYQVAGPTGQPATERGRAIPLMPRWQRVPCLPE